MTDHPIHDLNDDVHQRVRLGILASLVGVSRADFTYLKRELGLTDGNLGRHLEALAVAGLVTLRRETGPSRPRTWVSITSTGRKALKAEIAALRRIMTQIESADSNASRDAPVETGDR